jgi:aminopeptidase-like protein
MLSKHGLYPTTGGAQNPSFNGRSELDIILWILFLSDGRKSVDDISLEIGVNSSVITQLSEKLFLKGVLEIV